MSRTARPSRVDEAVDSLTARIVDGDWPVGEALPGQWELAEIMHVSRLTVREAVKELAAKGMVEVQPGNGTFVRPHTEWTDLAAVSAMQTRETGGRQVALSLIEVRRMIEVGSAGLAATRRTAQDLAAMAVTLADLAAAHAAGDVHAFVAADLAFHHGVLSACDNPFLPVVYDPLQQAMASGRAQTSAVEAIRAHALEHHRAILTAIEAGDAAGAAAAMDAHMDQTAQDLLTYVLGGGRA